MTRADPFPSARLTALAAVASAGAYRLGLDDVHNPGPGFMPLATTTILNMIALGRLVHGAVVVEP